MSEPTKKYFICDPVHGFIEVSHFARLLMDTKYFQRANKLAALSTNKHIYPGAEHTRKIHMIGAYHISVVFLNHIKENQPESNITEVDVLCVSIAALLHDIGHGPFSHTYEVFVKQVDSKTTFEHEEATKDMIDLIFEQYPDIKVEFDLKFTKDDYTFIKECISPPKLFVDEDNNWMLKGRPIEKSFLYEFVSNIHSGLDVDKFDYLLRDPQMAGIKDSPFGIDSLHRIITNCKVVMCPEFKYHRLAYAIKVKSNIENVFRARMILHSKLYVHKTCVCYEKVLIDIWKKADEHIKYVSKDGHSYKLSEIHKDIELYSKVTDEVVMTNISMSTSKELEPCREMLNQLDERKFPRIIYDFDGEKLKDYKSDQIEKEILDNCDPESQVVPEDFFVNIRQMHKGKKLDTDPVRSVLFYDKMNNIFNDCSSNEKPQFDGGHIDGTVYVNYHLSEEKKKAIKKSAEKFSEKLKANNL
uniref:HD domain-containing protein n=1 Tax=Rhabditophanes sp. KR3021 TaxID=114890 RepID=A0AC35THL7_9BILA